jgi:hypothetical protein
MPVAERSEPRVYCRAGRPDHAEVRGRAGAFGDQPLAPKVSQAVGSPLW